MCVDHVRFEWPFHWCYTDFFMSYQGPKGESSVRHFEGQTEQKLYYSSHGFLSRIPYFYIANGIHKFVECNEFIGIGIFRGKNVGKLGHFRIHEFWTQNLPKIIIFSMILFFKTLKGLADLFLRICNNPF